MMRIAQFGRECPSTDVRSLSIENSGVVSLRPCAAGRCLYLRQNPANEFVQKAYLQVFRWRSLVALATRRKTLEMPTLPSKANSSLYVAGRPLGQSCLAREEQFSGLSTAPAYFKHKAS